MSKHTPKPKTKSSTPARQSTTDWGQVADWYNDLVGESGSEYHRHVVIPGVLRLLDVQPGQRMLDLACGQGVLCRILAERGVAATGIDAAAALIRAARDRERQTQQPATSDGPISQAPPQPAPHSAPSTQHPALPRNPPSYHVGDARDLSFLPENHFDAATCILAIQNIHPIQPVFESAARVLRLWGRFVVVMMHPCFRGAKETEWGWDEANKIQYRRVDRYLTPRKAPITTHPGRPDEGYTWTFHKPLESYVKAARNAGLLIDALEEWPSHKQSQPGPRASAENTARKEIPMFLALRAIKASEPQASGAAPPLCASQVHL